MTTASCVVASVTQQSWQGFHSVSPSTENARRLRKFRWYDGTTSWWPVAERRWRFCVISETGTQLAARYQGPVL